MGCTLSSSHRLARPWFSLDLLAIKLRRSSCVGQESWRLTTCISLDEAAHNVQNYLTLLALCKGPNIINRYAVTRVSTEVLSPSWGCLQDSAFLKIKNCSKSIQIDILAMFVLSRFTFLSSHSWISDLQTLQNKSSERSVTNCTRDHRREKTTFLYFYFFSFLFMFFFFVPHAPKACMTCLTSVAVVGPPPPVVPLRLWSLSSSLAPDVYTLGNLA